MRARSAACRPFVRVGAHALGGVGALRGRREPVRRRGPGGRRWRRRRSGRGRRTPVRPDTPRGVREPEARSHPRPGPRPGRVRGAVPARAHRQPAEVARWAHQAARTDVGVGPRAPETRSLPRPTRPGWKTTATRWRCSLPRKGTEIRAEKTTVFLGAFVESTRYHPGTLASRRPPPAGSGAPSPPLRRGPEGRTKPRNARTADPQGAENTPVHVKAPVIATERQRDHSNDNKGVDCR